tara:strand:- start:134 stop:529 length:396 start_codon:yes stop_codon:yes gene_type:complete
MSKRETPLTRKYWQSIGGTLIEEFPAVTRGDSNSRRLLDGVVILGGENRIAKASEVDIEEKDIVVIQTKVNRLGMYLMGQAFFSRELMKTFKPKSIKTVAICGKDDTVMRDLCKEFDIEVVVYDLKKVDIS